MINHYYYAEVTDLFCGELNYSFCHRFKIYAKTELGAINRLARHTGLNFRKQFGSADNNMSVYHSTSKLTGVTLERFDKNEVACQYHTVKIGA